MEDDVKLALSKAWQRHHVKKAWLFGSRARTGNRENSDWDFLVEFSTPPGFDDYMGLKEDLEDAIHGRVDLVSISACRPRFLDAIKNDLVDVT